MQDKSLKHEIPDIEIRLFNIPDASLPVVLDAYSPTMYGDGQSRRRTRREQERKNKKK